MRDFRTYHFWEQSHQLVLHIYKLTHSFPNDEKFGITTQIRRAAISIPNNFAEGCGKNTYKKLARFLSIAYGSISELDYLILLSLDLSYIDRAHYDYIRNEIVSIQKQLYVLIHKSNVE